MPSVARSESLSSYLRQIGGRPQLTREQEYELARRARKGDASARDTLALSNLPFVVAVAKKYITCLFAGRVLKTQDVPVALPKVVRLMEVPVSFSQPAVNHS